MEEKTKRIHKVEKFQIIKPVNNMTWEELGKMLRDVRYRFWRLANMAVCENYMRFYHWRTGKTDTNENYKVKTLNRILRKMLIEEKQADEKDLSRYSRDGAVSGYINGAFEKMKLSAIKSKSKWRDVVRGKSALPLFRKDLAIPINCSDHKPRLIEKTESGEFEVDLRICQKPYPRVLLSTAKISEGERSILERLVSNKTNSPQGWRHRFFEIKEKPKGKWYLHVSYDFPKAELLGLDSDIVVGVDLGWSVPLYAAINNGYARIGYKKMKPLGDRIKHLQKQIKGRRLSIQKAGAHDLAAPTSRSGHGRNRILKPIEKLENKIDNAYTTLNHQLSHCVIEFAKNHGAGRIQIENLKSLKDELSGTFIGQNWRYNQLQNYIKYKAEEAGIKVEEVNPFYTSRRCSECGYIHKEFDRVYRDKNSKNGKSAMFECPECSKKNKNYKSLNADYNAARNLATIGIAEKIRLQCKKQGIEYRELPKD
ncbi:MAG: RNA-guided endonuclease TnpB family protein [Spirochaetia bacterium]|nr:RNA-guided endonuclease TnpB family protein [Spirochaetia bacterium]